MGKLIDADVFDSILRDAQAECKKNGGNFRFGVLNSVRANLANQPAVDAVPVVRCKDCMYFRPWRHDRGEDSRCEFWNAEIDAEDYCSQAIYLNNKMDGERRDGK